MKKTPIQLTALLSALVMLLFLAACGNPAAQATTMRLAKTEGAVGVSDGEGKDVTPAENLGLYSGYQVDTQSESYAWVDLDNVKLTKLDQNTEVEITKDGKKLEINVLSGSLFFNITEPLSGDEVLNIRTSTMMVGIRGTCGWVAQNRVGLLEGTVSVTAGDETVTISAGELAWLTQDGTLEVKELSFDSTPAFVAQELLNDDALQKVVLEASGLYIPTTYEELLSVLEKKPLTGEIVYSGEIDFERDNSPEFLVISLQDSGGGHEDYADEGHFPYRRIRLAIYRNGPEGIRYLTGTLPTISRGMVSQACSLAERDGRLFLKCTGESETMADFEQYFGSVAERDGDTGDWGEIDRFRGSGISISYTSSHDEKGFVVNGNMEQVYGMQTPYTTVRELYRIDGIDLE